jgi:hypothetical protein
MSSAKCGCVLRLVPADIADAVAGHRARAALRATKGETI